MESFPRFGGICQPERRTRGHVPERFRGAGSFAAQGTTAGERDRAEGAASIYLHAAVIDNLLQNGQLKTVPAQWLLLALLGISPLLSYQLSQLTHGRRLLAALVMSGGWVSIATVALASNYWLPVAAPVTLILLTTLGVAYCERQYTDFLVKREIDRLWQTHQIN